MSEIAGFDPRVPRRSNRLIEVRSFGDDAQASEDTALRRPGRRRSTAARRPRSGRHQPARARLPGLQRGLHLADRARGADPSLQVMRELARRWGSARRSRLRARADGSRVSRAVRAVEAAEEGGAGNDVARAYQALSRQHPVRHGSAPRPDTRLVGSRGGPDADIVVVGAGIVGAAAARALAGAFATVVLVEQHQLGHDRGSSHGTSRIFRLNYPEARYVRWPSRRARRGTSSSVSTDGSSSGATAHSTSARSPGDGARARGLRRRLREARRGRGARALAARPRAGRDGGLPGRRWDRPRRPRPRGARLECGGGRRRGARGRARPRPGARAAGRSRAARRRRARGPLRRRNGRRMGTGAARRGRHRTPRRPNARDGRLPRPGRRRGSALGHRLRAHAEPRHGRHHPSRAGRLRAHGAGGRSEGGPAPLRPGRRPERRAGGRRRGLGVGHLVGSVAL